MNKYVLISIAVVSVVTLSVLIDGRVLKLAGKPHSPNSATEPPALIHAAGRVEGATPEAQLHPRVAGQVVKIFVREGDQITSGQPLVQIDNREHQHAVAAAQAQVEIAEGELARLENGAHIHEREQAVALYQAKLVKLDIAARNLKRSTLLFADQASSQEETDERRGMYESLKSEVAAAKARVELLEAPARADEIAIARAKVAAAQATLERARVQLEQTTLCAPFTGQVLRINVEPGEHFGPQSVEPAIVLANTTRVRVRAFVEEYDAPRVQIGMPATIQADGLPHHIFRGRVTQLSPRMTHKQIWTDDPTERYDTKSREVWIDLEDHDRLLIGLRVDVSIDFNSSVTPEGGKNPQTLPTTAAAPATHPSQSVNQANRTPPRVTSSTTGEQPSTPAFTPQTPPAPAQPFQPYRATAHPPLPPTPSQREAD